MVSGAAQLSLQTNVTAMPAPFAQKDDNEMNEGGEGVKVDLQRKSNQ
jgi:hypothetical protein